VQVEVREVVARAFDRMGARQLTATVGEGQISRPMLNLETVVAHAVASKTESAHLQADRARMTEVQGMTSVKETCSAVIDRIGQCLVEGRLYSRKGIREIND